MKLLKPNEIGDEWRDILRDIPGYDSLAKSDGNLFDEEEAAMALQFFPGALRHVEGAVAGQPFHLEHWQKAIVANLFGWKRQDVQGRWVRRYREVMIYIPRKCGKSPMAAGIALFVLFVDPMAGKQCYLAAGDREQASVVFRHCKGMVTQNPKLSKLCRVYGGSNTTYNSRSIVREEEASFLRVVSADADTKHGGTTCLAIIDELHVQPDGELVDVFTTSMASANVPQPLMIYLTTADYNRESVCNTKYKYACGVRDGKINDPAFLPVIYEAARDDDWTDPEVWKRANPNYGISVSEEYLARECERAKVEPSYQNTFKRLHLNIQTESVEAWFRMDQWDACGADTVTEDMLRNNDCYAGLDLSSTKDITAFVLFFPDGGYVLPYFWLPGDTAEERQRKDGVPYTEWTQSGMIQETDKNHIDDNAIFDKICDLGLKFNIRQIAFDGWQAASMFNRLAAHGFDAVKFPQTNNMMNSPSKRLESMLADSEIRHGGHPVLRWMATNTVKEQDNKGFIRPSKKHSSEKIDGIAALIMAIGAADAADAIQSMGLHVIDDSPAESREPVAAAKSDPGWDRMIQGDPEQDDGW